MIHISHAHMSLAVPYRDDLAALCPHAELGSVDGEDFLILPHGPEETKLLWNLGFDELPPPIEEHYDFPSADGHRPFQAQVATAALMTMEPRCFVLNGMGTGKTKAAIWAFHFLKRSGLAKRMMVVAPLSTLTFTWQREIMMTMPGLRSVVLTGTAARRKKLLADLSYDIYIVNHHGLEIIQKEVALRHDINVMCFDEAAAYRNARSDRCKVAKELSLRKKYVWAMTGSPTPSAPTDVFGLLHLVHPTTAPKSFVHLRQDLMIQVNQFKWVAKRTAKDQVAKMLKPAVRYTLDEITELPPVWEREQWVDMGARQKETYKQLLEHAAVLMKEGGEVLTKNAADVHGKLVQTSIGWVYGNDGVTYELDNGERIKALMDIVRATENKIIIFSPFISAMNGIGKVLAAEAKELKIEDYYATVSGSVPAGKRADIFNAFQNTEKYKVLNAHPECMSHGLTLTAADTIVWFGPTSKLETYEQANARIRRIGQTRRQQVVKLVASPVETLTYSRLAQRQDLQASVLDIIAELTGARS